VMRTAQPPPAMPPPPPAHLPPPPPPVMPQPPNAFGRLQAQAAKPPPPVVMSASTVEGTQEPTLDGDYAVPLSLAAAAHNAAEMLRTSPMDERAVTQVERTLREGAALLGRLPEYAAATSSSHGAVWQTFLAAAPGGSTAGTAMMARTPPRGVRRPREASFDTSMSQRRRALAHLEGGEEAFTRKAAVAEALRGLLRLSLCDDADLTLAARVVSESSAFFQKLNEHAAKASMATGAAWLHLLSLPMS